MPAGNFFGGQFFGGGFFGRVIRGGDAGPSETGKRREYKPFGRAEIERIVAEQERLQAQLQAARIDVSASEAQRAELAAELAQRIEALAAKRKKIEEEEVLLLLLLAAASQAT